MDPALTTPLRLDLKRDEKLVIEWQDGHVCTYPLAYLRKNCPCATCKTFREEQAQKPRTRLTVFSKTSEGPLAATGAELVGGYALVETDTYEQAVEAARKIVQVHTDHWPTWEGEAEVRQVMG